MVTVLVRVRGQVVVFGFVVPALVIVEIVRTTTGFAGERAVEKTTSRIAVSIPTVIAIAVVAAAIVIAA